MTGAEFIVREFQRRAITRVFTYPGGTIAPILDVCQRENIEIVCARHEQGAGYMALAQARLSGQAQVVLVTSGPGVTNLVTPIADAYFDSTPLVALTGQVGTSDLKASARVRQRGFQQVDTRALMAPITKASFTTLTPMELAQVFPLAFSSAETPRFGPVVVDLPMDIQRNDNIPLDVAHTPTRAIDIEPEIDKILQVAMWLSRAERPVLFVGQGVLSAKATKPLVRLAETFRIPVAMSLLSLGSFPTSSSLSLGFVGHTGNQAAGLAIQHSDLLCVVGSRLDVRQTGTVTSSFAPNARIVRADIDVAELEDSRVECECNIRCDAKHFLEQICEHLEQTHSAKTDRAQWLKTIQNWKREFPSDANRNSDSIHPADVIQHVNSATRSRRVIVTSGVGSHQQWAARHFDYETPRRIWLTSGGHGAMGYDLPSAIGAQLFQPEALVICFVGDGSLQMNIQEIQTAVEMNTPIKIFVLDNQRLGIVSQFQRMNWNSDPTTGDKQNPDFAAIARAYGIHGATVVDSSDLAQKVTEVISHPGPALLHCAIDRSADVVPMLLAGETLDSMWPYSQRK